MQVTPIQRQVSKEQDKDNSLLSQSQTLPLGLANAEEMEEKDSSAPKPPGAPKKLERSQEMELMLLLMPTTLLTRSAPDADDDSVFTDTSRTLWGEVESDDKVETPVAAPAAKKRRASNPYHPGCCSTLLFSSLCHQYPNDLPQGTTLLIKEWLPRTTKKKDTGEEFKTFNLVDINGGLWYGVQSSPFGVNKW